MPENKLYLPEGLRPPVPLALDHLREALETGDILEAPVQRCGVDHTLLLNLGGVQGRIPREEAVPPGSAARTGTSPSSPGWESPPASPSRPWNPTERGLPWRSSPAGRPRSGPWPISWSGWNPGPSSRAG